MPFLRFARDKRGYEHIYLMHASNRRGKVGRPRILYWYRTPPGVKVGREPFDEEVRRTLEAQNPGVTFDWKVIVATPMPPPDAEPWRERRRAERAAKQVRLAEEAEPEDAPESDNGSGDAGRVDRSGPESPSDDGPLEQAGFSESRDTEESTDPDLSSGIEVVGDGQVSAETSDRDGAANGDGAPGHAGGPQVAGPASRSRRRRRRGRRRPSGSANPAVSESASESKVEPTAGADALPDTPESDDP